jgi:exosome complex RNA-binding protein Rrp42 (RNase PH superfamily)
MQKGGTGTFTEEEVLNLVDAAIEHGKELRKLLE